MSSDAVASVTVGCGKGYQCQEYVTRGVAIGAGSVARLVWEARCTALSVVGSSGE
ncbi:UNVERIFIED_CONTAM: hypothetical protein Sangu_2107200 [Sesamum angustifolium]|uniref:Uncharacterized protein n=1 Tax=Sesamum angustifolium TaxID=2727405 RepID=A0AAW2LME4_9LAMI